VRDGGGGGEALLQSYFKFVLEVDAVALFLLGIHAVIEIALID